MLKTLNIKTGSVLDEVILSPAFYQPSTLMQYSQHTLKDSKSFKRISAQFNYFPALVLFPEYAQACTDFFLKPRSKPDYLLYAKALLQNGERESAISLLESCLPKKWPEVYRFKSSGFPNILII